MDTTRLFLDSEFRARGTNEEPSFYIQENAVISKCFYINSINIPHSFYNVYGEHATLYWSDVNGNYVTTIPDGDYTISNLMTTLGAAMTAAVSGGTGAVYTLTRDTTTHKITITNNLAAIFSLTSVVVKNIRRLLGFSDVAESIDSRWGDIDRYNGSLTGASTYTANDTYYLSKRVLYIASDIIRNTKGYNSVFYKVEPVVGTGSVYYLQGRKDIIATIPINTAFGETINWTTGNESLRFKSANQITNLAFKLYDEYGSVVNLNGRSWTIELVFENI